MKFFEITRFYGFLDSSRLFLDFHIFLDELFILHDVNSLNKLCENVKQDEEDSE